MPLMQVKLIFGFLCATENCCLPHLTRVSWVADVCSKPLVVFACRCVMVIKKGVLEDLMSKESVRHNNRIPLNEECLRWCPFVAILGIERDEKTPPDVCLTFTSLFPHYCSMCITRYHKSSIL